MDRKGHSCAPEHIVATKRISRVLYWETIYLRPASPRDVKPPVPARRATVLPGLVLLRIGFTQRHGLPYPGELLPRLFILTGLPRRLFSVALSLESPPAAINSYPALGSPDFPPDGNTVQPLPRLLAPSVYLIFFPVARAPMQLIFRLTF